MFEYGMPVANLEDLKPFRGSEGPCLIVHRGTQEIGGSCIEIVSTCGQRLILDAGRPLDAPEGATGLLPKSLDREQAATVLISHPHQDHYGLVAELPRHWPVWTGEASAKLMGIVDEIVGRPSPRSFSTWNSRTGVFSVGPFNVLPFLTDHSAFDAYMLLIEVDGRRIFYTGDFRRHGRKSVLTDRLMASPPRDIDVLIMEGTNLGTDKPAHSEAELEDELVALFESIAGRAFVSWSAQNIDRTVTLYRAAKRNGRTLVVDLYTADVLDRVAEDTQLPRAGFPNLKVVVTRSLARNYRERGRDDFVTRMARSGISAASIPERGVVMVRRALIRDYESAGIKPTERDAFNFSMWKGYVEMPYYADVLTWCGTAGARICFLHTSGHASPKDLRAFATAMKPRMIVPVHGTNWCLETAGFPNIRRLADGEVMSLADYA